MRISLIILITIFFTACASDKSTNNTLEENIPETASTVVHTQNLKTFLSELQSNTLTESIWSNLKKEDSTQFLRSLDSLEGIDESYLALINNNTFSLIGNYRDSLASINKIDSTLRFIYRDSIIIKSNDTLFKHNSNLENSFISFFNKPSSGNTLFLDAEKNEALFDLFLSDSLVKSSVISSLDLAIAPKLIQLHGVTKLIDTLTSRERLFEKSFGIVLNLDKITPDNALALLTMQMPTAETISKASVHLDSIIYTPDYLNLLPTFEEIGLIKLSDNLNAIVATSVDISTSTDALLAFQEVEETHKSETIFRLVNFNELELLNYLFPQKVAPNYYAVLDDFLIFSEEVEAIKTIIDSFKSSNTLATSVSFNSIKKYVSDEASMQLYLADDQLSKTMKRLLNMTSVELGKFSEGIIQLVQDDGFMHFNVAVSEPSITANYNTVKEEFSVTLDADLLNDPQFVVNHRTKQKEIVVQDVNNTLYLISNNGKILWRKKISGPIQGKIHQVDLYKNGRLQLTFVTPRKLHVIDRNGNDVLPFPKSFSDKITQPLALFDYDKNKNYRFFIVQADDIVIYDSNAKFVKGFNYKPSGDITSIPKHIRHRGKDYITFVAGNRLRILNRRGADRITTNLRFEHSGNPVFFYQNKFTTSDASGALVQVDFYGKSSASNIASTKDHVLTTTSKTFVSQEENSLRIKDRITELPFGSYLNPQLFYLKDKIYVSTIDLQTNSVMLYDSQSKPIANFPVFGSSQIDFDNIDGDNALELVVKGDAKTIIVYQKN